MGNLLFTFGHGYSAQALARILLPLGWQVAGTTRSSEKVANLRAAGIDAIVWPGDDVRALLQDATHLLVSVAPNDKGDPVIADAGEAIKAIAPHLDWVGYLSTT